MAGGLDTDEVGKAVDWDGSNNTICLGVDHGDGAGLSVYGIDFVADGVGRETSGVGTDLEGAVRPEIDKVEHRDGVRGAVTDIGVLAVTGREVGEAVTAAAEGRGEKKSSEGCEQARAE